jgi:hypothetical protein
MLTPHGLSHHPAPPKVTKERDMLRSRLEAAEAAAAREAALQRRELRRKGKEWQEVRGVRCCPRGARD